MLCTEVISDFRELEAYRDNWNQLLRRSNNSFFLTWEWVSTWWEFFGKSSSLFVIVVKDADGNVAGIAPLKISPRRICGVLPVKTVEFIGHGSPVSPEHLDLIVPEENYREVVTVVVSALMQHEKSWDALVLSDVDENSPALPLLRELFSQRGMPVLQRRSNVCPYLNLPSDWDSLLNSYSYNMRRTVRRTRKRLESSFPVRFVLVRDEASIGKALESAATLHRLSRRKKGEGGSFDKTGYLDFHIKLSRMIADRGWLYLAFLEVDESPIAFRYGYNYEGKYYDYQTGYDPKFEKHRVGWVMLGYVIEDLIGKSVQEFDFLRGGHGYKWHWAKTFRKTQILCCSQTTLAGLAPLWWWRAKDGVKKLFFPRRFDAT